MIFYYFLCPYAWQLTAQLNIGCGTISQYILSYHHAYLDTNFRCTQGMIFIHI
jgi:hypothetical protein